MNMILTLVLVFLIYSCESASVTQNKLSKLSVRSHFPTEDELRSTAEAVKNGVGGDSAELFTLEELRSNDWPSLTLRSATKTLNLRLQPSYRLISPGAKVRIIDGEDEYEKDISSSLRSSFYHGLVDGDADGDVAVGRTSRGWNGLIATGGERFVLHAVPDSNKEQYLLLKMEEDEDMPRAPVRSSLSRTNAYNMTGDESFTRAIDPAFEFEIGVYADDELYKFVQRKYPNEDPEHMVQEVLLITMNTIHTNYQKKSMGQRITVIISRLTIMKTMAAGLKKVKKMEQYLNNFCEWDVDKKNPGGKNYDFGLLFSGWDMYGDTPDETEVLGMSPLEAACLHNIKRSCAIGEATGYGIGLIMTHEVGHNLGMDHDGDGNKCKSSGYIMGAYISAGATQFSSCSRNYLRKYLKALDDFGLNCLRDNGNSAMEHSAKNLLPGERLKEGEQCSYELGDGWTEYYDTEYEAFCTVLTCVKNEEVEYANNGGPPLPGTYCAENKICWNGKCQNRDAVMKEIASTKPTISKKPKRKSLSRLCRTYGSKRLPQPLIYNKQNRKYPYVNTICDEGLLCKAKGKGFKRVTYLAFPAPSGTPCGKGKRCKAFKCKK